MAEKTVRGQFVWHDLMTPDVAGAHAFYSRVLGWKSEAWDQDPSYSMFAAASGPLGGSVALPTGTPHWLHYIGTQDIEATVQQVTGLGGSVKKEITTLPGGGGRYAVLTDPQGAAFGVYGSESAEARADAPPRRGEFSWHELATTDCQAAFDFYSAVFGWEKAAEHDMGAMGVYLIFSRNGNPLGGMFNKPPEMKGDPTWLGYVRVKDVHQTVEKVKSARGTLINGPMEVPGGDWIAQFIDPYGAMFAAHTLAADVKAARPAASSTAASSAAASSEPPAAKPAAKKPARKPAASGKPLRKKAAKKAKKKAAKKAKKSAARQAGSKKKSASKKRSAARGAKRPARKAAKAARKGGRKKVAASRKRSAKKAPARKKTAKRPRKAK